MPSIMEGHAQMKVRGKPIHAYSMDPKEVIQLLSLERDSGVPGETDPWQVSISILLLATDSE